MNHHMVLAFEGWMSILEYGRLACLIHRWRGEERMIPMPSPGGAAFEEAKAIVLRATGLEMGGWVVFARPPEHTQVLHSDCALGPAARAMCGLNIPIIGGPGSVMEWYADRLMKMITNAYGTPESPRTARYFVPAEKVTDAPVEVCDFSEAPVLVDTYLPHRVISGPTRRAVVSIRFVGNPSFDEVRLSTCQRKPIE